MKVTNLYAYDHKLMCCDKCNDRRRTRTYAVVWDDDASTMQWLCESHVHDVATVQHGEWRHGISK